ncbi:hypothetical protein P618_201085 [Holospora obtusa F1]|uniref:Uncharacterized protein n=1 Tax=Holospora obtusa F1 TaxID=1399147 RepID=W6TD27_HOLOB|nr:hypothetical protein [Holospora obtusa]ETZ06793.1 hypothetical protein P618_201085 [Holospora obtusa F1]
MKNCLVFLIILGGVMLSACQVPVGNQRSSDSCQKNCERNATNFLEREECLSACAEKGKSIRSMPDRSGNFYNGVSVKNPMNERNSTASRA